MDVRIQTHFASMGHICMIFFPELFKWKLQPILKIALVVSITVLLAYSMRKQIINPNLVSIELVAHPD